MTNTVTFETAMYRNKPVAGTFEMVQDFTRWGGTKGERRVGNRGQGYLKVMFDGKLVKVTVTDDSTGYAVNTSEEAALDAEIAELDAMITNAETAQERSKFRKRLDRRLAKRRALETA